VSKAVNTPHSEVLRYLDLELVPQVVQSTQEVLRAVAAFQNVLMLWLQYMIHNEEDAVLA
jgi:hypothetical protein